MTARLVLVMVSITVSTTFSWQHAISGEAVASALLQFCDAIFIIG